MAQIGKIEINKELSMATSSMVPAVVLPCQATGLVVIRALGLMGVPVTAVAYDGDNNNMGVASKYAKTWIRVPQPERDEEGFLRALVEYADRSRRPVLIPADDATVSIVSRHKAFLESYYIVACVDSNIAKKFINKKFTYELAEKSGVPAPKTVVPHSIEDIKNYSASIDFPCLIKPCQGHQYFQFFRKKVVKVNNVTEMIAEYNRASEYGYDVMIQELIPGNDSDCANYNSFFWDGEPL